VAGGSFPTDRISDEIALIRPRSDAEIAQYVAVTRRNADRKEERWCRVAIPLIGGRQ